MKRSQKIASSAMGALLLASGGGGRFFESALSLLRHRPTSPCRRQALCIKRAPTPSRPSWPTCLDDSYTRIANVQGAFEFNQKGTTPNDELFNVFGTAILSMCSKPAQELVDAGEGQANFFVNVSGDIQKTFSVDVSELDDEQGVLMAAPA